MNSTKRALLFTLVLLPVIALAGYFVTLYQLNLYEPEVVDALISEIGSKSLLLLLTVIQTVFIGSIASFLGYLLADKVGLIKPFAFRTRPLLYTVILSLIFGIIFSLDYWTFGVWIPGGAIRDGVIAGLTWPGWLGAVLYGGIVEELLLRWLVMSLLAWLIWKVFFRKFDRVPVSVLIIANIIAALLFAAGHLPATITLFGGLTWLIVFRCFLLNGAFGLLFGWLFRQYGIQYAMVAHALLHIFSKTLWSLFI